MIFPRIPGPTRQNKNKKIFESAGLHVREGTGSRAAPLQGCGSGLIACARGSCQNVRIPAWHPPHCIDPVAELQLRLHGRPSPRPKKLLQISCWSGLRSQNRRHVLQKLGEDASGLRRGSIRCNCNTYKPVSVWFRTTGPQQACQSLSITVTD